MTWSRVYRHARIYVHAGRLPKDISTSLQGSVIQQHEGTSSADRIYLFIRSGRTMDRSKLLTDMHLLSSLQSPLNKANTAATFTQQQQAPCMDCQAGRNASVLQRKQQQRAFPARPSARLVRAPRSRRRGSSRGLGISLLRRAVEHSALAAGLIAQAAALRSRKTVLCRSVKPFIHALAS